MRNIQKPLIKKVVAYLAASSMVFHPMIAAAQTEANDKTKSASFNIDLAKDTPLRALGQRPQKESLEGGIWALTDKVEEQGKISGDRTKHGELETYVQSVMNKLVRENKNDIRVYVMDRPAFNASVAPNGYTEVWTGLLLRVQTEDELAFVLGHEAAHFMHSHSLTAWEAHKRRQNTRLAVSVALTVVAAAAAANAGTAQQAYDIMDIAGNVVDIAYLSSIAATFSFTRDQERYADLHGYNIAKSAGYYPRAGEFIWENIIDDVEASNNERAKKRNALSSIFNTHPIEKERVGYLKSYNEFNNDVKSVAELQTLEARTNYRKIIRPYLNEWLSSELRKRDYGETLNIIDRLLIDGEDKGVLNYYRGESLRMRAKANDLESAATAYKAALEASDAPKTTSRQLGEVFVKLSRKDEAKTYFQKYLNDFPNAEDAWIIKDSLDQMNAKSK